MKKLLLLMTLFIYSSFLNAAESSPAIYQMYPVKDTLVMLNTQTGEVWQLFYEKYANASTMKPISYLNWSDYNETSTFVTGRTPFDVKKR